MSKQSQDALAAIERVVFQSDKPIVVALTGGLSNSRLSGSVSMLGALSAPYAASDPRMATSTIACDNHF